MIKRRSKEGYNQWDDNLYHQLVIRLSDKQIENITALSAKHQVNKSDIVRYCINLVINKENIQGGEV